MLEVSQDPFILKGIAAQRQKDWNEAGRCYRLALHTEPATAHYLLAELSYLQQDYVSALEFLRVLRQAFPDETAAYLLLGRCLFKQGDYQASQRAYHEYLRFYTEDYRAYLGLAELWRVLRQVYKQTVCLQSALRYLTQGQSQAKTQATMHLALNLCYLNQHHQAQELLVSLLADDSKVLGFQQNSPGFQQCRWLCHLYRLSAMYADAEVSDQALFACIHSGLAWFPIPQQELRPMPVAVLPNAPLKIGYLSREFGRFTTMQLLEPLLQGTETVRYAYHDVQPVNCHASVSEDVPERFRACFKHWRTVGDLDALSLARQIQADGIQILVDVGGFAHPQRHSMLAYRPAPIQITGPGFLFTAAHPAADYCFSDPVLCPPELAERYPEKVLYLDSVFHLRRPEESVIQVPPCVSNGFVTLGSANAANKLNFQVVRLWSRILLATPNAQLFLKNPCFDEPEMQLYYRELFQAEGIAPTRLRFEGGNPPEQGQESHLSYFYRQLDIALDPFPYQGGVNTFEALWMGVPVVVMSQPQWRSRALGLSILNALGLSDWAVCSETAYLQRCLGWAQDLGFLQAQRQSLRQRAQQSGICDGRAQATKWEQMYQQLWLDYTAQKGQDC